MHRFTLWVLFGKASMRSLPSLREAVSSTVFSWVFSEQWIISYLFSGETKNWKGHWYTIHHNPRLATTGQPGCAAVCCALGSIWVGTCCLPKQEANTLFFSAFIWCQFDIFNAILSKGPSTQFVPKMITSAH